MRRELMVTMVVFIVLFTNLSNSEAKTHTAVSCSKADVQAAYDNATNGDTLVLPLDTAQWDASFTMNKEIKILGAGVDKTIIKQYGFSIENTDNWSITGITFDGDEEQITPININGCKNFRIGHSKFVDYLSKAIYINLFSYGLIDNNQFIDCAGEIITIFGDGATGWSRSESLGGYETGVIFIEDNTFTQNSRRCDNPVDSNSGARWVLRNNTINANGAAIGAAAENHGCCVTGVARGTVSVEIYENTINDNGGGFSETGFKIRGGRGVVFNNTINDNWIQLVKLINYRSIEGSFTGLQCTDKTTCGTLDDCASGYPCLDQVNNFYVWGNTKLGESFSRVTLDTSGCSPEHIQEDRDFFIAEMPGYTPYTYPHPLQGVGLITVSNINSGGLTISNIGSGNLTISNIGD